MLRILRNLSIVLITAIVCIAVIYFTIPLSETQQAQFDLILVLGNPANPDGSISPLARSRVLEGVREYRAGAAPRILFIGGAVQNQYVEAQVMARFAESQGVPSSAVIAAGESRNTIENAFYAFRVMEAHDWHSALIVSSPSHLRRAGLIFRYYPIAWRMQAAPWPPETGLWKRLWLWSSEAAYTSYARLFGFPGSQQYLPHGHFSMPRI